MYSGESNIYNDLQRKVENDNYYFNIFALFSYFTISNTLIENYILMSCVNAWTVISFKFNRFHLEKNSFSVSTMFNVHGYRRIENREMLRNRKRIHAGHSSTQCGSIGNVFAHLFVNK